MDIKNVFCSGFCFFNISITLLVFVVLPLVALLFVLPANELVDSIICGAETMTSPLSPINSNVVKKISFASYEFTSVLCNSSNLCTKISKILDKCCLYEEGILLS